MNRTVDELCNSLRITYRQLDLWCRDGLVSPRREVVGGMGPGYPREFTSDDLRVLRRMAALVREGMTPRAASRKAHRDSAASDHLAVAWAAGRGEMV